jgi:hypothetical protein
MKEEILYHIWQFKQFSLSNYTTLEGERISVEQTGQRNHDSGPDYTNARIHIGNTLWAGDVEIHYKSSDWIAHNHQNDPNYEKVILHVVWENDKEIKRKDGSIIPFLELKGKVKRSVIEMYSLLLDSKEKIPCQNSIEDVDEVVISSMLNRALVERLEGKGEWIKSKLDLSSNNWEYVAFSIVGRYLFGNANKVPFDMLFTPSFFKILMKERSSLFKIEALVFGSAGFLEQAFEEDYPNALKREFIYLKAKYQLKEMDYSIWKFMRMHPSNFPSIRLSQFASLVFNTDKLFNLIIESRSLKVIKESLIVSSSPYWNNHYRLDVNSEKEFKKRIGSSTIDVLLINAIVPSMFIYGQISQNQELKDLALNYLEEIKPEKNTCIKKWESLKVKPKNAFDSQALLQLYNNYCKLKKCLNCTIGNHLIKSIKNDK